VRSPVHRNRAAHPDPAPDVIRVEIERLADPEEREDPHAIVAVDPATRLLEGAALAGGAHLSGVHIHRVLEDRVHQTADAALGVPALALGEELCRHERARLERRGQGVVEVPVHLVGHRHAVRLQLACQLGRTVAAQLRHAVGAAPRTGFYKGIDGLESMGICGTGPPTNRMNDDLLVDARMRTLSVLSGATMHELRGAANSLALHLQLLAIESLDDDTATRRRRSLAAADDGRRRLFDIAEVFVRHAALPDTRPSEFDLARVTGDAVALSRPYAVQRRVDVTIAPSPVTLPVLGRRDVVSQVVLELLLGFLDRAPNGGSVDVTVGHGTGAVQTALSSSTPGATPDPAIVARAESAMRWAGGTLRLDDGSIVLQLPVSPPGESS
jgi:hypothetical protein